MIRLEEKLDLFLKSIKLEEGTENFSNKEFDKKAKKIENLH